MTITTTDPRPSPESRTNLDRHAIRLAGRLLVTGAWVEREAARRFRELFGSA